jgi:hypothetical protein
MSLHKHVTPVPSEACPRQWGIWFNATDLIIGSELQGSLCGSYLEWEARHRDDIIIGHSAVE